MDYTSPQFYSGKYKCPLWQYSAYRVSQKFVPLLYKSVTQYNWRNSICVISRQRCAARVNFPAIYFLHFVARNARTPNLFRVNILKDKPSQRKKHSATCEQKHVFLSTGFSVKEISKKKWKNPNVGW